MIGSLLSFVGISKYIYIDCVWIVCFVDGDDEKDDYPTQLLAIIDFLKRV